jgi:hypothetical protein
MYGAPAQSRTDRSNLQKYVQVLTGMKSGESLSSRALPLHRFSSPLFMPPKYILIFNTLIFTYVSGTLRKHGQTPCAGRHPPGGLLWRDDGHTGKEPEIRNPAGTAISTRVAAIGGLKATHHDAVP